MQASCVMYAMCSLIQGLEGVMFPRIVGMMKVVT